MATLKNLSTLWLAAKQLERSAQAERIQIEEQIIALCDTKEEGSSTQDIGDGVKITTTGKLTYKADLSLLDELTDLWPEDSKPVKLSLKLDESVLKNIRRNEPELWRSIAKVVEVKPAKTGVVVSFEGQ
jgi:hypothetical protein